MAVPKLTNHEQAMIESLCRAVHGLSAPFACGGTLVPDEPVTISFPDKTQIAVLRAKDTFEQRQLLDPLFKRCTRAPFGKGRKTLYDHSIRDALQFKAEGNAFSVLNFDPAATSILEQIRHELVPQISEPLSAELYSLNIYKEGGHFVQHKDTPRGNNMLGTLVVCLPSQFLKGELVIKHLGVFQTFNWGEAIKEQAEPTRIHWAAFFGDVDHQIERLWGGLRVTLTYLIRYTANDEKIPKPNSVVDPSNILIQEKFRALLQDRRFLAKGGTLAFPCSHLYHHDARFQRKQRPLSRQSVAVLKGRDHNVAAAALAEGLAVTLCPYMIETCADETWQLEHFPTPPERASLEYRMDPWKLEEALAIQASCEDVESFDLIWVDPPPHFNGRPTMYPRISEDGNREPDPDLPALAHLHECEYSATGYFGNEGSDIDLYTYGALHVAIPTYDERTNAIVKIKQSRASSSSPRSRKGRK